ncbi:MAG: enolase C-terminal domain-like protein [Terracidiphilus sp.]
MQHSAAIESVAAAAYRIPTEEAESDGTLTWDSTTIIVVTVDAAGAQGVGYTYGTAAIVDLISGVLANHLRGHDAFAVIARWSDMLAALRNIGRPGIGAMAVSAVDTALWDLKAKLVGLPLATLLGQVRAVVPVYGSGGFTSYSRERLAGQLAGWVEQGIGMVKMKVGREPKTDATRVADARAAIGDRVQLFVDANGAYQRKQALTMAREFAALGVTWFEEPVSSDDLEGLRLMRDRSPPGIAVAAGEYGHDEVYFRRMLEAGAVDVLQADVTRCGGITGFMHAAALCRAFEVPLSAHCAPALHLHLGCALPEVVHLEYFHDHVRIEELLFEGTPKPVRGALTPNDRAGLGLTLKRADAERYRL